MKEFKPVVKTINDIELTAITCNKCGSKTPLSADSVEKAVVLEEFQSFVLNFGYGSKFDLQEWKFELCEKCLEEFINTFKVKPEIEYF